MAHGMSPEAPNPSDKTYSFTSGTKSGTFLRLDCSVKIKHSFSGSGSILFLNLGLGLLASN